MRRAGPSRRVEPLDEPSRITLATTGESNAPSPQLVEGLREPGLRHHIPKPRTIPFHVVRDRTHAHQSAQDIDGWSRVRGSGLGCETGQPHYWFRRP